MQQSSERVKLFERGTGNHFGEIDVLSSSFVCNVFETCLPKETKRCFIFACVFLCARRVLSSVVNRDAVQSKGTRF